MDDDDLFQLAEALFANDAIVGRADVFLPGKAWSLDHGPALSLFGVLDNPPQCRLTTGVAVDVEMTGELALALSAINAELWNGRCYVNGNPETNRGVVKFQHIVFGDALAWDHQSSVHTAVRDINTQINKAVAVGPGLIEQFGGRQLVAADIGTLLD